MNKMDSLLVDLDKVLDDLEAEENNDVPILPPGHEIKPSGYEDYLEQHSERPWKLISEAPYQGDIQYDPIKPQDRNTVNIMYDIPYEPTEKFDLSEADFAPSPTVGKNDFSGTSIYDISKGTENDTHLNSDFHKAEVNKNRWNEYDLSKTKTDALTSNFVKNDLQNEGVKLPVQAADLSPDKFETFQMNGHATDSELYLPKQDNLTKKQQPVDQALILSSVSSTSSNRTMSDTDKFPVQCNTPSTPYENVYINPFDSQIKLKVSEIPEPASSLEVYGASSTRSSHSDSQDGQIDFNIDILSQNQSLSKADPDFNSVSSLPADSGQPNRASQFHSLPPTLGLQRYMQGINQNGFIETVEENPKEAEEKSAIDLSGKSKHETEQTENLQKMDQASVQQINKDDNIQNVPLPSVETRLVTGEQNIEAKEPEIQNLKVCGFDHEVELNENELDDYLGKEEHELNAAVSDMLVSQQNSELSPTELCAVDEKTNDRSGNVGNFKHSKESQEPSDSNNVSDRIEVTSDRSYGKDTVENKKLQGDIKQNSVPDNSAVLETRISDNAGIRTIEQQPQKPKMSLKDTCLADIPSQVSESTGSAQEIVIPSLDLENIVADSGALLDGDSYVTGDTIVDSLDIDLKPVDNQSFDNRLGNTAGSSLVKSDSEPQYDRGMHSDGVSSDQVWPETKKMDSVLGEMGNIVKSNEGRQLMDSGDMQKPSETENVNSTDENNVTVDDGPNSVMEDETVELPQTQLQMHQNGATARPQSWGPSDSGQSQVLKQKRPTSLNLPPRPEFHPRGDGSDYESPEETGASGENVPNEASYADEEMSGAVGGTEEPAMPPEPTAFDPGPPPPYSTTLGKIAPKWVPDAEAPACMNCDARFTFTKRRHHCRACGKVFCSQCCNMRNRLAHMENKEGRVCFQCHMLLLQEIPFSQNYYPPMGGYYPSVGGYYPPVGGYSVETGNFAAGPGHNPHPNNPTDYCSTVPPAQQVAGSLSPPSVLVPVAGVLKRDGGHRRSAEPKQVMFSDGIRPGGDLTELDGSAEVTRMPPRRSRVQKKVERHSQDGHQSPRSRRIRTVEDRTSRCLIPEEGLPPLVLSVEPGAGDNLMPNPQPDDFMQQVRDEEATPVIFAITPNLHVSVKIVNLDCCVNHVVWCFTTQGMCTVGQEELVTALEVSPDENTVPRDIFTHLYTVYEEASKGNVVTEMGHTIFNQSFLGSRDHGGFLYVRATFQCIQKFVLPQTPYLFAILLQKWETPWAKVFPIRLMLRLGAEYRYYPCPLIGVRNRKPVYFEIGHTIMNLLADFRNYQYMLPQISGITIHMEDKVTWINFPKNRYDELMKVVNNSNEHVMAIGASFSMEADSHLVCMQNDDGNYQTQAINIQNKPRKVTGASFVVFNGALKTSSGMSAKSSIVEDGLMVQITPDSMLALKQALKDMQNYTISCGTVGAPKPEEMVKVQWVEDDRNVNMGVKSPIDNMPMDGIDSLHIYSSPDYAGENQIIRWTEVFFIQNDDSGSVKWDPVDLSRLGETLATACCMALIPHLGKLKEAALTKIGLRVTIKPEMVGYEAGACGERLPDIYMNDLDNELIPVMHRATQQNHVGTVLELIFQILN